MKPSELRLRNYCQTNKGHLLQVSGLNENGIDFYLVDRNNYPIKETWKAEPIPLTEEWLLTFGFISNPYKDTYEKKYVVINCDKTKGFLDLWLDSLPVDIKHVHQLQNLYFALTGEELEINS